MSDNIREALEFIESTQANVSTANMAERSRIAYELAAYIQRWRLHECRPAVLWFAEQMEAKLQQNDHKADWLTESVHAGPQHGLFAHLDREVWELADELDKPTKDPESIIRECADVANLAMMIADHYGSRIGSGRNGGPER